MWPHPPVTLSWLLTLIAAARLLTCRGVAGALPVRGDGPSISVASRCISPPPPKGVPDFGCLDPTPPLADESLASYLATTAPQVQGKCLQTACGDNATHHLKTFLHGCMRVTLSVTVLPTQDLPGADRGQIWVWARPLNADLASAAGVRRVPLSLEASCLSFGAPQGLGC